MIWRSKAKKAGLRVKILMRQANFEWQAIGDKHVAILNRLIDVQDNGGEPVVTLEPDRRHVHLLREACGLSATPLAVTTLGNNNLVNYDQMLLSASKATSFRSSTMRLAFVAADIPVFAFVARRLARHMAKRTVGAWSRLKRCFPIQDEVHQLDVCTDTDWAQVQIQVLSWEFQHTCWTFNRARSSRLRRKADYDEIWRRQQGHRHVTFSHDAQHSF